MSGVWAADIQTTVQIVMGAGCTLMGLSHVLQPRMWQDYLQALHKQGVAGVLTKTMIWEFWPALIVVAAHQVWRGPGLILTVFGWLLLIKCIVSLVAPQISLRSMAMSRRGAKAFVSGGLLLIGVGLSAFLAAFWR
jgi:UPF0716 family protein affecting phage T7 exclusion